MCVGGGKKENGVAAMIGFLTDSCRGDPYLI